MRFPQNKKSYPNIPKDKQDLVIYPQFYEPSPTPMLYVGPVSNVLGRVPLMPLFLRGNITPTIPHYFRNLQRSEFPYGSADDSNDSGRKGSNVYKLNQWLWEFGRGKPRFGGLSDSVGGKTEERRIAVMQNGPCHPGQKATQGPEGGCCPLSPSGAGMKSG